MRSKRIDDIKEYIYQNKTVTLDQLCEEFQVSKNTIRRDIDELVETEKIKKIYGGVTVDGFKPMVSFDERNISNLHQKQVIAKKAAELANDNEIIFIDSGTTTVHMIEYIKDLKNLTILTNNIEVIMRSIPYPNINIISLSGTLNRKTLSFTGSSAANVLSQYNISKSFVAATGISIMGGCTNSSPAETEIKRTALMKSQKNYLLVDHTKFDVISLMTFSNFDNIDSIITDSMPPASLKETLSKSNCGIILADDK
ncbi:DeoR/GlpR family DNA-binding transcription regulator [Anaerocolumna aminovalerica]|jgi:DeoR family myo-inositol catabolism operon transcriptional repressor|uniref:Transcriptional regulator, DeoR family n=1 Tax=Anaerocolumna aminovalerica TaxID=1527 RepID=A0A1I5GPS0_9FIRM|nr:DeoR/GlpR family DNA-binding transcription regulator [Anaerocolumna aminovalerica]MBU5331171.1 DeoR/GlpR family DNA-binding transcription regulator [Anaerocolumna aminovalerica]MDU6263207.1 DeoR/GlpR family DNA-binding transcription regulator [Anaerocolumna aminovalerica]SFO37988.1 transcriptional regulator, DeoR family [Anaerocolumna aminovalerica]